MEGSERLLLVATNPSRLLAQRIVFGGHRDGLMQGLPEYRSVLHNPRAPEELVCPGMRSRLLHPRQEAALGGLPCRVQVPIAG